MPLLIYSNSDKIFSQKATKIPQNSNKCQKIFAVFVRFFAQKKFAEIRKNFQKNIFSSKKIIKKFRFFYRFFSFSPVKVGRFLSPSPIFHRNFSPLKPKHHPTTIHQSITQIPHLFAQTPHPPHIPILLSFPPCLLFHLCFHSLQSILFSYSFENYPFPTYFNNTCFNKYNTRCTYAYARARVCRAYV